MDLIKIDTSKGNTRETSFFQDHCDFRSYIKTKDKVKKRKQEELNKMIMKRISNIKGKLQ